MKCSIILPCFQKGYCLERVLTSIFVQKPSFDFEVIVVDDGPEDGTKEICEKFTVQYFKTGNTKYRNPSFAKNIGYRMAKGDIFILQSSDVVHIGQTLDPLVNDLKDNTFNIATVYNVDNNDGRILTMYTGLQSQRPLFFLGSVLAQHVCKIGGESEDFYEPSWEDVWFVDCLIHGAGLKPVYMPNVIGHHLNHPRPADLAQKDWNMFQIYNKKCRSKVYFNNNILR